MDFTSCIWMIGLCITHLCAYYMGRTDGEKLHDDAKAQVYVEMHKIDKHYEHMRWIEERKDGHDENA